MRHLAGLACGLLLVAPRFAPQTSGVTTTLRGISAVSDTVAWASGSGATVLRTADGGATWRKLTIPADPALDFRDVDAIDERTAYVLSIGNGSSSRIYKTTDAGEHWELQFTNQDGQVFFDAMAFWDADRGMIMADSIDGRFVIMTTENGGRTWRRVPPGALPPALANEGAFAASGTNIAVYGENDVWIGTGAAPTARVLHSADRGRTWTIAPTPLIAFESAGIFSVAFRDTKNGVVVGGDYKKEKEAISNLAVTSDGGKTWALVLDHGLSGFRSVVAYVPHATTPSLVAVGPQGADFSTDDGRTWTPIAGSGFHTLGFSHTGAVGWAAGGGGTLAKLSQP